MIKIKEFRRFKDFALGDVFLFDLTYFKIIAVAFFFASQGLAKDESGEDLPVKNQLESEDLDVEVNDKVTVIGQKSKVLVSDANAAYYKLSENDLSHFSSRNLIESMKLVPGVLPQKTSYGQGSPYIRGFTGFHTVLTLDGIRLNNSIYRSGPNEYSSLIDSYALNQISVLKGASGVLYGSDAVGGVIAVDPVKADLHLKDDRKTRFFLRAADAEESIVSRVTYQRRFNSDFAYHLGATGKWFGDIKTGGRSDRLKNSGYHEWDYDLSMAFPAWKGNVTIFWQEASQDDVWRNHKTIYSDSYEGTTLGSDQVRKKDLVRRLGYIRYKSPEPSGFLSFSDAIQATLSYQELLEERDRTKKNNLSDVQAIDVYTTGVQIDLISNISSHSLKYGLDAYSDIVQSSRRQYNDLDEIETVGIQGPVGDDAHYLNAAVYLQGTWSLWERLELVTGLRDTLVLVDVDRFYDPTMDEAASLEKTYHKTSGSISLSYGFGAVEAYRSYVSVSEGFRAPNLSDLTRLDDARTNVLERPSTNLKPETFTNYEVGIKSVHDSWKGQFALFRTEIDNMITLKPQGTSADGEIITEKSNAGKGFVQGWEADIAYQMQHGFEVRAFHSRLESELSSFPGLTDKISKSPLSRMQPPTSRLIFSANRPMAKISLAMTHAAKQNRLSFADQADTQRIPPKGTPEYYSFDLYLSHRFFWLSPDSWLNLTVENIADRKYRIHGSGQNELGRNIVLSLDARI